MKKHYAILLGGLLCASTAMAQSDFKRCAAHEVLQEQLQKDPQMQSRMDAIEAFTQKYVNNNGANKRTAGVITIPVVVHVVYNTASQNISDCQIQSQIDVINEDFRRMNADKIQTPGVYATRAADCEIQFVLAKRDPNGNATTGITRTSTRTKSFSANDAIKFTSQGGKDAWNTTQYLNFWTAPKLMNQGQQLLGYGQFPGGPRNTDGVVMAYAAFGSRAKCPSGVYYQGYDLGRTTTHEIGHNFNLRHIWGDATCGNDLVSDTPTQQGPSSGCPSFPRITCSNVTGDMTMNYMDYSNDNCMNMFTLGQKARMDATLVPGAYHYELTTSLGGYAPGAAIATNTGGTSSPEGALTESAVRTLTIAPNTVFPNPVTGEMNVSYAVAKEGAVKIEIYNIMGAKVGSYDQGVKAAGSHIFNISTSDDKSFSTLKNGVYFCRVNGAEGGKIVRFVVER